jgi:hypothetical protein
MSDIRASKIGTENVVIELCRGVIVVHAIYHVLLGIREAS